MSQNPNPYESTSYGSNPPGGNQPNSNYPYEQYEPTQRAGGQSYPPPPSPYGQPGQPVAGQGSNPSYPQYAPQQPSNPYQYQNPPTPPPPAPAYNQPNQPAYAPGQFAPPSASDRGPGPRRSRGRMFLLIGLATLVILAGIIAAIAIPLHNSQVANDNATATAHTQGTVQARNSTATAQAVAQANATATAQNIATATAVASTYPFSAAVKLDDPLSDNSHGAGWKTNSNCSFTGGAYHAIESTANTYYTCPGTSTNFSNFTYQVTMQITKGDIGGITFRGDDANSKYYSFIFDTTGSYVLFLYTKATQPATLKSGSASSFNTGTGQSNDLGVVARGNAITLYVNKQELATVNDSTYSSGQIGMIVYNTANPVEAAYSNLKVWQL